ncbi:MAG TPA: hypothetical protein DIT67_03155 [Octadecabacter sp.]|mgnify:CR=1 FL=1|nr:hypothetical protein [Octadecabacter sp.]
MSILSNWLGKAALLTLLPVAVSAQTYGDWMFQKGESATGCRAVTFSPQLDETIMFQMLGMKEAPGFEGEGPHVGFLLTRESAYPSSSDLVFRVSIDSAGIFDFEGAAIGGTVGSSPLEYDRELMQNFVKYSSAGSYMSVDPGNGFFPIGFSLRGSSRALRAFEDCMYN